MARTLMWTASVIAVLVFSGLVLAQTAPAPIRRTGQANIYRAGDDGDLRKGVPWPWPRFTDNGDGTVSDNLTGLMWLKSELGSGTWQQALDAVKALNAGGNPTQGAGYRDWRLPNLNELRSMLDYSPLSGAAGQLPPGHPFMVTNPFAWSSTTNVANPAMAWIILVSNSSPLLPDLTYSKKGSGTLTGVRPVRTGAVDRAPAPVPRTGQNTCYDATGTVVGCAGTGQDGELQAGVAWPNPRFTLGAGAEADCVVDHLTGLMWPRSPAGLTTAWQTAVDTAKEFSLCGYSDWHLPNVNEAASLRNAGERDSAPWLKAQGFGEAPYGWSSTTCSTGITTNWVWAGVELVPVCIPKNASEAIWFDAIWPVRGGSYPPPLGTADLSVTNHDSADPVTVGTNVTYTVTVRNHGPDPARGVILTNARGSGALISATVTRGTCAQRFDASQALVECVIGDFAAGETVVATIVIGSVMEDDIFQKTYNFAAVAGATDDPDPANNQATEYTAVQSDTQPVLLVILRPGASAGTVTGTGIACPGDCTEKSASPETVLLTANANTGFLFRYWTGCDSSAGNQCTVTMNGTRNVSAIFAELDPVLSVYIYPNGGEDYMPCTTSLNCAGKVTGTGFDCPGDCSEHVTPGQTVTLTATPNPGYVFDTWTGCETMPGNRCTVTTNYSRGVAAHFGTMLTVNITPAGWGTVDGGARLQCPGDCSEPFHPSSSAWLVAKPSAGYAFSGWVGCSSGNNVCTDRMNVPRDVTAVFTQDPQLLTVIRSGSGAGTVISNPAGIDCGATCSASFPAASVVTLSAKAASGSTFAGWGDGGTCYSGPASCTVTMDAAKAFTATFLLGEPSFDFQASPASRTILAGESAQYYLEVLGRLGFTDTVSLSCTSGLPQGAACTFNPASLTYLVGTGYLPGVLAITTTASHVAQHGSTSRAMLAWWLIPLGLVAFPAGASQKRRRVLLVLAALAFVLPLVSCGADAPSKRLVSGTPSGTYSVTVTANSGSISRTQTLTLVVN